MHRVLPFIFSIALLTAPSASAATPPGQPASGPGGASYSWSGATVVAHSFTRSIRNYTTYVPTGWTGGGAQPARAPVVLFMHGANATNTSSYASWLTHLARKGNIVVFPVFQTALTPTADYTPNAEAAVADALTWLEANAAVKPDLANGVLLVGHSYGGVVSINYANHVSSNTHPRAAAVLADEPWHSDIDPVLSGVASTTKLVCVVGDEDKLAGRKGCDTIWTNLPSGAATTRNYLWMFSD